MIKSKASAMRRSHSATSWSHFCSTRKSQGRSSTI